MTVKENLVKAREVLIERGLAKRTFVDGKGCVCALGAVAVAVLGEEAAERDEYGDLHIEFDLFANPEYWGNDELERPEQYGKAFPEVAALSRVLSAPVADFTYVYQASDNAASVEEVVSIFDRAINLVEE